MFGLFKNDPPKERSLSEGFGVLGTLSLLLGVFGDPRTARKPNDEPKLPHWDEGGSNHWNDRQCGYWPD